MVGFLDIHIQINIEIIKIIIITITNYTSYFFFFNQIFL